MEKDERTQSDRAWSEEFRARLNEAQKDRTNKTMARLLGMGDSAAAENTYSRYRTRSLLPLRYLIRFCEICGVTPEWLCEGRVDVREEKKPSRRKKAKRPAA